MQVCSICAGHGLVQRNFAPNPKQPLVQRTENIRCPACNGMGIINARPKN